MVPTFGLFEFESARKAFVSLEDQERSGYLSEVVLQSTEFGAGNRNESEASKIAAQSLFNMF
ncbi:hypothetical protein Q9Q94_11955 [Uliginosibacterium sp. 31-16]|uniref:hypothetical protein n=1 Tax=Uliginosibacterium sp. 31-16 TaxID=3068315 RepID=UPI00273E8C36|nr:hypothetical protein [Uliginosibacterium sp. 31-16]MDP5240246.1 hypothetical protein [Uliginosibacterium sp. 31-16]